MVASCLTRVRMENYVEQRLNHLHDTGTKTKFKQKILTFIVAALVVFFLPYLHIGINIYISASFMLYYI